ncbi:hypothetical protein ACFQX4_00180 [Roseomonas sp. GCM10028921]
MIDRWSAEERGQDAMLRMTELPKEGQRFILVYGDVDDASVTSSTGPFETLEEARSWFLKGGR